MKIKLSPFTKKNLEQAGDHTALAAQVRGVTSSTARASNLPTRYSHGGIQVTSTATIAWFALDHVRWDYTDEGTRNGLLNDVTLRLADLGGRVIEGRLMQRPIPVEVWERNLTRDNPHPLPALEDAPTFGEWVLANGNRMRQLRTEEPAVYIGVHLGAPLALADLPALFHNDKSTDKVEKVRREFQRVQRRMKQAGFGAKLLNGKGLDWLTHASVAIGAPYAPGDLLRVASRGPGDLEPFTGSVAITASQFGKYVTVRARRKGVETVNYVSVLVMSEMEARDPLAPSNYPWMAQTNRLDFPVEWAWSVKLATRPELMPVLEQRQRTVGHLDRHLRHEHGIEPDPQVVERMDDAVRIKHEVATGDVDVSTRAVGVYHLAVWADTPAELQHRVETLIDAMRSKQRITLEHPYGQYELYRRFWPGGAASPTKASTGFVLEMELRLLALGLPHVATRIGDGAGPYVGPTLGAGRSPFLFDPCWGPRHNRSGLIFIIAALGGGKSVLAGHLVDSALWLGRRAVVFDPAGEFQRMAQLEHLAGYVNHVDLMGARPGTLNPYLLVPEPRRQDYDSADDYYEAVREASAERIDLMVDVAVMLVPHRGSDSGIATTIENAVAAVGGDYGTNPWRVVEQIKTYVDGQSIAESLEAVSRMKGGSLIFPEDRIAKVVPDRIANARLTIFTMKGLTAPDGGEATTRAERMAIPVLHLAARYATRFMYADKDPKLIILDEAAITGSVASGRAFALRASRDSRKRYAAVCILGQNPVDVERLSGKEPDNQIGNLAGAKITGKLGGDTRAADAALRLHGLPLDRGFQKTLLHHESGRFLVTDFEGNTGLIQVDLEHRPDLRSTLFNTPGGTAPHTDDDYDVLVAS